MPYHTIISPHAMPCHTIIAQCTPCHAKRCPLHGLPPQPRPSLARGGGGGSKVSLRTVVRTSRVPSARGWPHHHQTLTSRAAAGRRRRAPHPPATAPPLGPHTAWPAKPRGSVCVCDKRMPSAHTCRTQTLTPTHTGGGLGGAQAVAWRTGPRASLHPFIPSITYSAGLGRNPCYTRPNLRLALPSESGCASYRFRAKSTWPSTIHKGGKPESRCQWRTSAITQLA
jgi:hypothetical protein